jgi:hypothetical protein
MCNHGPINRMLGIQRSDLDHYHSPWSKRRLLWPSGLFWPKMKHDADRLGMSGANPCTNGFIKNLCARVNAIAHCS